MQSSVRAAALRACHQREPCRRVSSLCDARRKPRLRHAQRRGGGLLDDRVTDLTATLGSSLEIELLKRTPSISGKLPLQNCRTALTHRTYEKLFAILKKMDIGYFFYIGGNDSMDTICKLSDYAKRIGSDIRFMGVPKTIDNDLMHTDHAGLRLGGKVYRRGDEGNHPG